MALPISQNLKTWKEQPDRSTPIAKLYDVEITDSLTIHLMEGNPSGNGSLVYGGNTYTAASIAREEHEQNIEGALPAFRLAISNIDGVAGGFIEKYVLEGRRVTITSVLLSTLSSTDAMVETYTIQDQSYDRRTAVLVLGHPNFFRRRVPARQFVRHRCRQDWENRFVDGNGCGFPSDQFEADTRQDLIVGATTALEQKRRFGWHTLNPLNSLKFSADIDYPGSLYIETQDQDIQWSVGNLEAPFVYKKLTGDFDVFTQVQAIDTRIGCQIGILCQEAAGGFDSWVFFGLTQTNVGAQALQGSYAQNGSALAVDTLVSADGFLRLKRVGDIFYLYSSADIVTAWTLRWSKTVLVDADVRLGLSAAASPAEATRIAAAFPFFQFRSGGLATCSRLEGGVNGCGEHNNLHRIFVFPGIPRR